MFASRPHNGQISEASAICCPHLAQNIEVLAKPLKPSLIAAGLAFFARLLNEIGQLPRALLLQQLFHGSRNDWVGAQDALVGSQSAFHAGCVLGDAVVLFVGVLDEKHDIAEQHLIHELRSVAVARGNQIETKHGGTGRDVDVRNVLDPLQGPFLFCVQALVERVLLQLARQIHEALALLRSGRGTLGCVLRGVLARKGTRRRKQHEQQEEWEMVFHNAPSAYEWLEAPPPQPLPAASRTNSASVPCVCFWKSSSSSLDLASGFTLRIDW